MKEGTKVRVVAAITGHEFGIGEIVERKYLEDDDPSTTGGVGFYSESAGEWYMEPDEYEIIDKSYVVDTLTDLIKASIQCSMSSDFTKDLADLVSKAKGGQL